LDTRSSFRSIPIENSTLAAMNDTTERTLSVIPAEKEDGCTEYKRQLRNPTPSRLRSLATQMSYRLDEGMGRCTYQVGVEDDGCHSLLDYASVAESARIIECIARSLNAVVLERLMIQGEVTASSTDDSSPSSDDKDQLVLSYSKDSLVVVEQPSVMGDGSSSIIGEDEEKEEKTADDDSSKKSEEVIRIGRRHLIKEGTGPEAYTRCELTIQRVETHLLDPTPLSLASITRGQKLRKPDNGSARAARKLEARDRTLSSVSDGVAGATELTTMKQATAPAAAEAKLVEGDKPFLERMNSISVSPEKEDSKPCALTETLSSRNIRIAVVGNVDAGKSTLIGALTTSTLDDGRGRCRTSIMKHRHEIETGRTSTAQSHLMGFKSNGEPISGRDSIRTNKRKTEDEVARESYRICTLIDLAGHEKYLKTTIHGVSSGMADYGLILVNSRHPPTHMTQHHLNLCCSFGIPVIIVFTKIDGCPEHAMKNSKEEVHKLLRAPDINKRPFAVRNEQDVATCIDKLQQANLAPIIDTSCVSGEGLDLLRKMLFALPKRRRHEKKADRPFEFLVEDIFNVPGVGSVVSGFVNAGSLVVGSNAHVYVGPTNDGSFMRTVAKSAHIARINTSHITAGQSACLAFSLNKDQRKQLRRGMVVMKENPTSTREFDAEICVLKGEGTTIRRSYQAYVHILNVRQSAFAKNIEIVNNNALGLPPSHKAADDEDDGIVLRPGSRAKVRFEFAQRPEYIRPGMRMLFRDGRVRGVGIITDVPEIQAAV